MAQVIKERMTAKVDGDFVVFLIGMRINRPWKVWKWFPAVAAMARMLTELGKRPELGLLHARSQFAFPDIMVTQYWRGFEQLHHYATDTTLAHLPAWKAFNQAVASNGDVGIWHETYLISAGAHESVYNNMPAYGLGAATTLVSAIGNRKSAKERLRAHAPESAP